VVPAGTNNINFEGPVPIGGDPSSTQRGTYFVYTGTGSAIAMGDTSGTSYNHRLANVCVDLVNAGNAAIGIDSSRTYHVIFDSIRVIGKITATAQIGSRNNGSASAPGSQNMLIINPYFSNCFIGHQNIGGNAPPTCNMNQIIGGEFTGPGSGVAGSIGIDTQNGNNNGMYGVAISNYETALNVASTSARAIYGDFHSEAVVNIAKFSATANNNCVYTDSATGIVVDAGGLGQQNTVHSQSILTGYDYIYGALRCLGISQMNQFSAGINIKSGTNTGFPAATSGGAGGFIGAGFNSPSAIRIYCGDGTGFQAEFAKRTASTDTIQAAIGDNGKMVVYGGIATAGNGLASVNGATSQKSESAVDANVLTVTPAAVVGSYRLRFVMSVASATAAILGWTATWTDSNGNAQTPTNFSLTQIGTAVPALTFTAAAAGNYYGQADIDVNAAAVNIVIKLTLVSGSFSAKVSATVERLI
jgi:hypothetical protein